MTPPNKIARLARRNDTPMTGRRSPRCLSELSVQLSKALRSFGKSPPGTCATALARAELACARKSGALEGC